MSERENIGPGSPSQQGDSMDIRYLFFTRDTIGRTLASLAGLDTSNIHPDAAYHYKVAQTLPGKVINSILDYITDRIKNPPAQNVERQPITDPNAYFGGCVRKYMVEHNLKFPPAKKRGHNSPNNYPTTEPYLPEENSLVPREERAEKIAYDLQRIQELRAQLKQLEAKENAG